MAEGVTLTAAYVHSSPVEVVETLSAANAKEEHTAQRSSSLPLSLLQCLPAVVVLYSEYTLKTTGCGLPAGPGGVVGAVEGLSYLGVVGIAGLGVWSNKSRAGTAAVMITPATVLSVLSIAVGCVVLGFQIVDYGYIPNAVPMEGGMCE